MELLANDLSLAGQFSDIASFRSAIGRVMVMRQVAARFGRALHCHKNMAYAQVTPTMSMQQAIQLFTLEQRQALLAWLTQRGPFWEEARMHGPDEYLQFEEQIVTDTALGEAAFCNLLGIDRRVVSLSPSSWEFSPIPVTWIPNGERQTVQVINHLEPKALEDALRAAPRPITSWEELQKVSIARCPDLTFSEDAFGYLKGHPFVDGAAQRILALLDVLHEFKSCFDDNGQRTQRGHELYQDHFTGKKAWFSDTSDADKHDFEEDLTFRHPIVEGEYLFCSWHGKVKIDQIRIHFSWPIRAGEPVFVAFVGPKITKH
jgi:hypothetical protein